MKKPVTLNFDYKSIYAPTIKFEKEDEKRKTRKEETSGVLDNFLLMTAFLIFRPLVFKGGKSETSSNYTQFF